MRKNKNKINDYSFGNIQVKFIFIIISISLLAIIIITSLFSRITYKHLEKQTYEFYKELINQLSTNIDREYTEIGMTLSHIYNIPEVNNALNAHKYENAFDEMQIKSSMTGSETVEGGLRFTVSEKIDGHFFIIETDRSSVVFPDMDDHVIHRVTNSAYKINYDLLMKDDLMMRIKNNSDIKMIIGKLGNGVISGIDSDKMPAIIYPYYKTENQKDFTKFILVLLFPHVLDKYYKEVPKFQEGTLIVLDQLNSVIVYNKFETYIEQISSRVNLRNKHKVKYADINIISDNKIKSLIDDHNSGDTKSKLDYLTYKNNKFLLISSSSDTTGIKFLYFHPISEIRKPINHFLIIIIFISIGVFLVVILLSTIMSWFFAKPIIRSTDELKEINEKLKKLDKLKNSFITNISHDFRSPISIILSKTQLALRNKNITKDKLRKYLKAINNLSLKLNNTINTLLDLGKMDVVDIKLNVAEVNIVKYIKDIVEFYKSCIQDEGIQIIGNYTDHEIVNFYTDLQKIEIILNNLIGNSIKFVDMKYGKIIITIEEIDENVLLKISDNGIGIKNDELARIFERFEQGTNNNHNTKGTGIGLAFVKELVISLHGTIHAESEGPGQGSTFIIELPKGKSHFKIEDFAKVNVTDEEREELKQLINIKLEEMKPEKGIKTYITKLNEEDEYDIQKALILFIDDNKGLRESFLEFFEYEGYKNIILATDGKEGIEAIEKYSPDLIICDYDMPILKGDKVLNYLNSNKNLASVPFIFISAINDQRIILEQKKNGATAFIEKPVNFEDLIYTINNSIKKYFDFKKTVKKASFDELTTLLNKDIINSYLLDILFENKFNDLSVIFLDIDHFKEFNDKYGHQVGDQVLKEVGLTLKNSLREYDRAGRYGGEEFVLILKYTHNTLAYTVAERIRDSIKNIRINVNDEIVSVRASIGIASLKENEDFICRYLKISGLKDLFEDLAYQKHEGNRLINTKKRVANLLINMSDSAMYRAKSTICKDCNFTSVKSELFVNGGCPQCGSTSLVIGRDKIENFDENYFEF